MMAVATLERDAELMLRVREGDTESFTLLLERHRSPVIHFLYRIVQNQSVAEELAQEVFLRVYRSRANYEPTAKFTTWLFRIASHLALNWIRDRRHERGQESWTKRRRTGWFGRFPTGAFRRNMRWCGNRNSKRYGGRSKACRRNRRLLC